MKLVPQRKRIKVTSMDQAIGDSGATRRRRHGSLLPDTIRCLVCGPSNCGKTNAVLCLLLDENGLRFRNVYLYSKTPFQPKYVTLGKILEKIPKLGYYVFSDTADIVKPKDAKPNSIFIFDDVACDKQDAMRDYFSMGRHNLIDTFYICQTYSRIPKQLIRDNANLIVLFRQDEHNLKHTYEDHVNTDMSLAEFKEMCALCWRDDKHGFLVIDKDSELNNGRYRRGFDTYIKK